ncbi:MAG: Rpn family recombination-promoting nuclease/putative transposase [bacterium]|nr:Rpn family recombination-promoting nuclease/putative transposase [bacterium]
MTKQKTFDELTFTDDFMFCKTMQNNEDLCRELLELILGKKIKQITYPEKQKTIEITSDGKGIRLDIYVEDENETIYDVEMQAIESKNLPKRSRYYQGMIDLNLIERGADYQELKKSYVIFICLNDYFGMGLHKYSFSSLCNEMPELQLKDEAEKIFLCAGGTAEDVSSDMKAFLDYLTKKEATDEFTKRLDHAVVQVREHEEWRLEYMTLYMRDRENREIGREEGREEKQRELIRKALEKGKSCQEVASLFDIAEEEVEDIKKSMLVNA